MKFPEKAIPEHIKRLIPAAVRASMGHDGKLMEEVVAAHDDKAETAIQNEIAAYLRLNDIEFILPSSRKRSPLPVGWPDITACYKGIPLAIEVKTPVGKLRPDQVTRHEALRRNGWRVHVVRGVPDVQAILRGIDGEMSQFPKSEEACAEHLIQCKNCGHPESKHAPALYLGATRNCPSGFHWSQETSFSP